MCGAFIWLNKSLWWDVADLIHLLFICRQLIHTRTWQNPNEPWLSWLFPTLSVWLCHHTFGVMHESVTNSNKTEGQSCLLWEPLPSGKMSLFIFISSHHLPPPLSLWKLPYAFAFPLVSSKISNNLMANYDPWNISLKYRAIFDIPLTFTAVYQTPEFGHRLI